jgi:hypothetical protein
MQAAARATPPLLTVLGSTPAAACQRRGRPRPAPGHPQHLRSACAGARRVPGHAAPGWPGARGHPARLPDRQVRWAAAAAGDRCQRPGPGLPAQVPRGAVRPVAAAAHGRVGRRTGAQAAAAAGRGRHPLRLRIRAHHRASAALAPEGTAGGAGETGSSTPDRGVEARLRAAMPPFAARAQAEFLAALPLDVVLQRLRGLPEDTVVFTPGYFADGDGRSFTPRESAEAMAAASSAPLHGPFHTFIGIGVLGGFVTPFELIGRKADEAANLLLDGASPASLHLPAVMPTVLHADWRQLQRWGIDEDKVPRDAVIMSRTPGFFESHRTEVGLGAAGHRAAGCADQRGRRHRAAARWHAAVRLALQGRRLAGPLGRGGGRQRQLVDQQLRSLRAQSCSCAACAPKIARQASRPAIRSRRRGGLRRRWAAAADRHRHRAGRRRLGDEHLAGHRQLLCGCDRGAVHALRRPGRGHLSSAWPSRCAHRRSGRRGRSRHAAIP